MRNRISAILLVLCTSSAGLAAPITVDATGCLHVSKTGPSATCTTKSSLTVELDNTCKMPIKAQLCLRGGNHLWSTCAVQDSLAPQKHFYQTSCDSDGDYTYWGCSQVKAAGTCGGDNLVGKASNAVKAK